MHVKLTVGWLLCCLAHAGSSVDTPLYQRDGAAHLQAFFYSVSDRFQTSHQIAAYRWSNANRRLVFMVHGYADNCGYLKPLQLWFLGRDYDVLCVELPGHGNSSGKRADIASMYVYLDIYRAIFPQLFALHYESFIFYGHSTGNVGMIEYLLDRHRHRFDHIIMATPLIRSYLWGVSRGSHRLLGAFVKQLPRRNLARKHPEYQALAPFDPAPIDAVPLNWFARLIAWNEALASDTRVADDPVTAIFAAKDTVIDSQYNRRFLQQRFYNLRSDTVAGSDHVLHYADSSARQAFYLILDNALR